MCRERIGVGENMRSLWAYYQSFLCHAMGECQGAYIHTDIDYRLHTYTLKYVHHQNIHTLTHLYSCAHVFISLYNITLSHQTDKLI